jgi:phospholipase/carboxylesterase
MTTPGIGAFTYRFEPATATGSNASLLLLHGTGGNEGDLVSLAGLLAPGAAYLSPRGHVLENGMPRWFRRLAEGVLDEDDLRARAGELADFVEAALTHHGLPAGSLFAVGFSNGANIASALMMLRPALLAGAMLFRPMLPFAQMNVPNLDGRAVWIGAGDADPMVPHDHSARLAAAFEAAGAEVTLHISHGGHGLMMSDVEAARDWLSARI